MAHTNLIAFLLVIIGMTNGFVLPKQQVQYYRITGLDGGVLTAHAGPPPDGHAYPAAGKVKVELLNVSNSAQEWSAENWGSGASLFSKVNNWNDVRVYFICPSCFPVDNYWTIEETGPDGFGVISTTFILDDKISCIMNNGLNKDITFGLCDRTPGSSSQWKLVPITSN